MLQGMATSNIQAADVAAATEWYTALFGVEPYFVREGYTEFRIGRDEDEFGIIDARLRARCARPHAGRSVRLLVGRRRRRRRSPSWWSAARPCSNRRRCGERGG